MESCNIFSHEIQNCSFFGYCAIDTKTSLYLLNNWIQDLQTSDITYCDLHFNCIWGEVDHDWQHRRRRQGDTPRKEKEEDQTAKKETHRHGDAHVQFPEMQYKQIVWIKWHVATSTNISVCIFRHTNIMFFILFVYMQLHLNSAFSSIKLT